MSNLLKEIKNINKEVGRVLERAEVHTDSDLRSLTREDLLELFPGPEKLKLRRTIFDKIQKHKPVDVLIRELKDFIPHESFRAALTNNGVLVDYLHILKDMKTQMNYVHSFLDAHIGLLEEFSKNQPEQESDKGTSDTSGQMVPFTGPTGAHPQGSQNSYGYGTGTSDTSGQMVPYTGPTGSHPQRARTGSFTMLDFVEVKYQTLVSGKTFGADQQLMDKVKGQVQDRIRLSESSDDGQITIVFCPISSRIGSDIDAAMTDVKGDKPVILVLMHHTRVPKYTTSARTWSDYPKVVLHVNVFYHDTMSGLLSCQENNAAVSAIQKQLLEYSPQIHKVTSGNGLGAGAESGLTGSSPVRGGGNDRGSDIDSSSSGLKWPLGKPAWFR